MKTFQVRSALNAYIKEGTLTGANLVTALLNCDIDDETRIKILNSIVEVCEPEPITELVEGPAESKDTFDEFTNALEADFGGVSF